MKKVHVNKSMLKFNFGLIFGLIVIICINIICLYDIYISEKLSSYEVISISTIVYIVITLLFILGETVKLKGSYIVEDKGDFFLFKFNSKDHRRLNKEFTFKRKKNWYIFDDGETIIKVPANKDIFRFIFENLLENN